MPAVSVILSAFNSERYVEAAVRSILAQTFGDFEFIIVDDGSTDRTGALLTKLASEDARIRLTSRPNTGYVKALNEAAGYATGKYLARMDADDLAMPKRFAAQVALLEARPEVVLVGSCYELIDDRDRLLRTQSQPEGDAELQRLCLAGTTPLCHPTTMFRRDAFERAGRYDDAYCPAEDLDMWLKLGEMGALACLPEPLLQYRLHAQSVSETKQQKQIDGARAACEAAARRRHVTLDFRAAAGWRETGPAGQFRQLLKYGWWAFGSGHRQTARAYGLLAIRKKPLAAAGWKLLAASLMKKTPR